MDSVGGDEVKGKVPLSLNCEAEELARREDDAEVRVITTTHSHCVCVCVCGGWVGEWMRHANMS